MLNKLAKISEQMGNKFSLFSANGIIVWMLNPVYITLMSILYIYIYIYCTYYISRFFIFYLDIYETKRILKGYLQ